jgi:hypothetical protein
MRRHPEASDANAREPDELTIRPARADDASDLSRLGELDAGSRYGLRLAALARAPEHGQILVAEANGALVAALDLRQDRVVADPFKSSETARELLRVRSRQLRHAAHGSADPHRTGLAARLLPSELSGGVR